MLAGFSFAARRLQHHRVKKTQLITCSRCWHSSWADGVTMVTSYVKVHALVPQNSSPRLTFPDFPFSHLCSILKIPPYFLFGFRFPVLPQIRLNPPTGSLLFSPFSPKNRFDRGSLTCRNKVRAMSEHEFHGTAQLLHELEPGSLDL